MDDSVVRQALVDLLTKGQAHVGPRGALADVRPENRHRRPKPEEHSVWEQLEHLRLAQEDIVRYTLDASWKSPEWPSGYWPDPDVAPSDEAWAASVAGFFAGLEETVALARDKSIDLTARIPHGEGRTYLRQVLLVADHNAYHLGQLVATRKALGDWPSK
ncbi:MAG TPA: DinB family protein [Vicinamibacteria bacterium]